MAFLQVVPYESKIPDEETAQVAFEVLQKMKEEASQKKSAFGVFTYRKLNPTLLCLVATRPQWNEKYPYLSTMMVVTSLTVSLCHSYIVLMIYLDNNAQAISNEWNILQRGALSDDHRILFRLVLISILLWNTFHMFIQSIQDFLLQIHVLKPPPHDHFILPVLDLVAVVFDWLSMVLFLWSSLVVICEVSKSSGTVGMAIVTATMLFLSQLRVHLCTFFVHALEVAFGNDRLSMRLHDFLTNYIFSDEEKLKLRRTRIPRMTTVFWVSIVYFLINGVLIYELFCLGVFHNCFDFHLA